MSPNYTYNVLELAIYTCLKRLQVCSRFEILSTMHLVIKVSLPSMKQYIIRPAVQGILRVIGSKNLYTASKSILSLFLGIV